MRWFSRVGAWLRGSHPGLGVHVETDVLDGHRLPSSPASTFHRRLVDAARTARQSHRAVLETLDPSVLVLALPSGERAEEAMTEDIDAALLDVERQGRGLSSLTWSALKDARPPFFPSHHEWGGDQAEAFDGEMGLVFFIDIDAIARSIALGAQGLGFSARLSTDRPVVIVSDGKFEAHIGINPVIAEALWTARGPLAVVARRTRSLSADFRSYQAIMGALRRRYPTARIEPEGDALRIRRANLDICVDYRHVAASARSAAISVDQWLDRTTPQDIKVDVGDPAMLLRSLSYLRANPDALHELHGEAALVAVRIDDNGRADVIRSAADDPSERIEHYRSESRRQMSFLTFAAHGFVIDDDGTPIVGLIGDRVASIVLAPELIRGVIEHLFPPPDVLRVVAVAEDAVLIAPSTCSDGGLMRARERLSALESDLTDDASDRLVFDEIVDIPTQAAGTFSLALVDDSYFEYREEAETALTLAADRGELFRGLALQSIGQLDKAISWFERAVRAHANDGEAHLALGQALSSVDKHARAIPHLERAVDLLPQNAEARNMLGLALYVAGHVVKARDAFESAVKLEPMDPAFLVNLGKSYADTHLFQKARACLERALKLEPASAEAHASMAFVCQKSGDGTGARRHARQALAESPDDEMVTRLLSFLDDEDER